MTRTFSGSILSVCLARNTKKRDTSRLCRKTLKMNRRIGKKMTEKDMIELRKRHPKGPAIYYSVVSDAALTAFRGCRVKVNVLDIFNRSDVRTTYTGILDSFDASCMTLSVGCSVVIGREQIASINT